MKSEPIEELRDWCKNSNRRAPIDDIIGAIEAYDTLQSQLTQAQADNARLSESHIHMKANWTKAIQELVQAHKERDEAVAACAVMWEALGRSKDTLIKASNMHDMTKCSNFIDKFVLSFVIDNTLSTSAGKAFLDRMKEAEWLLSNHCTVGTEWYQRLDEWLKGSK